MIFRHICDLGSRLWLWGFFPRCNLLCAMKIEELEDSDCSRDEEEKWERQIVSVDAKRALVGAGARILFYPTLLYNVLRNKIEAEFRWWDQIDEVLLSLHLPSYDGFVSAISL